VSQFFVLTAAHCSIAYPDITRTSLLAGDHDITTGQDTVWAAAYRLNKWIRHTGFNENTGVNDIALAQTQTYIRFKYFIIYFQIHL
jgi:secreted trypsin-like serine protease